MTTGRYDRPVLHIATVHYRSPRWIEIQARYLREHISVPYRVWTSLEGIDSSYAVHFDHVIAQAGPHAGKLNHLAVEIMREAADDDLLMFLDGDAFPIADPMPVIADALARAPLVAVRRAEHMNDPHPHPCFCVTTVAAWRDLPGDWSMGYAWVQSPGGPLWTDVGANLHRRLQLTGTPWVELLRSNQTSVDPMYFAIYHDIVYHHGSSFRPATLSGVHHASGEGPKPLPVPSVPVLDRATRVLNRWRWGRWERAILEQRSELSRAVFEKIRAGGVDWLAEIRGADPPAAAPAPALAAPRTGS